MQSFSNWRQKGGETLNHTALVTQQWISTKRFTPWAPISPKLGSGSGAVIRLTVMRWIFNNLHETLFYIFGSSARGKHCSLTHEEFTWRKQCHFACRKQRFMIHREDKQTFLFRCSTYFSSYLRWWANFRRSWRDSWCVVSRIISYACSVSKKAMRRLEN